MKLKLIILVILSAPSLCYAEKWPDEYRSKSIDGCLHGMVSNYMSLLKSQGVISDSDSKEKIAETENKVRISFVPHCECVQEKFESKYSIERFDELKKDRDFVVSSTKECAAINRK